MWYLGYLQSVSCMCLLLALISKMDNFIGSYNKVLGRKHVNDEDKRTIRSSVLLLLRRHSSNNQLCCHDNENNLQVTGVDSYGFITHVECTKCRQTMDTACYDAKWSYERIYDEDKLKPGDHICWHRPCVIWHHAIVTAVNPLRVIHYSDYRVQEEAMPEVNGSCSSSFNALYRINYDDCYDAEYALLRAQKLKGRKRYDLLESNCEHFSRWCKTGSTKSTQVGIVWASVGKLAVTVGLRILALMLLGLLQYSHESQEDQVKDRQQLEDLERQLIIVYMCLITAVFMLYLLVTTCSRLAVHPDRMQQRHDIENPCSCSELYDRCTQNDRCLCCCCCCCGSLHLFRRAICCLWFCRHINCSPCTCCRRPCNLACGLFWRIFIREMLAAVGTLLVVVYEEPITNAPGIARLSATGRTALLIMISTLTHIGGYVLGAFLGRWLEACITYRDYHRSRRTATVRPSGGERQFARAEPNEVFIVQSSGGVQYSRTTFATNAICVAVAQSQSQSGW